jgi:predicted enzyme involved in methoxymalonyl-ACP biosynthesis
MSCRAYGKNAETAFLIHILNRLKSNGIQEVYGEFVSSQRNNLVRDFYIHEGFIFESAESDKRSRWKYDLKGAVQEIPSWITMEIKE